MYVMCDNLEVWFIFDINSRNGGLQSNLCIVFKDVKQQLM